MMTTHRTPRLLRETAVEEEYGLKVRSLQAWRFRGGGPEYVKAGRSVLYPRESIEKFIEQHRRTSTSDAGPLEAAP